MALIGTEDLQQIRPHLEERSYGPGDVLLHQGQLTGRFHIITQGQVHVFIEGERRVRVATLGPGSFIGEMSTLTGDPASATVEAAEPVVTLSVDQEGLLNLIDINAMLRRRVLSGLIERIKNTNTRVKEENLRSAVMAEEISRQVAERYGPLLGASSVMEEVRARVARLTATQETVAIIGEPGTGKQHLAARLHYDGPRREHPFMTVEGRQFNLEQWRRESMAAQDGSVLLLHADELPPAVLSEALAAVRDVRVLLTGTRLPVPGLQAIELPPLRERAVDIPELVRHFLVESGVKNPQSALSGDSLRYLVAYPYLAGNVKELEKVIREAVVVASGETIRPEHVRLGRYRPPGARPRIGLALGSGAVRGGAHVGVIRVLEREGIPVDLIAGSSAGAMAGGLYAAGLPVERIAQILCNTGFRDMFRWILSKTAVWENTPMARSLERYFGGPLTFDALKIPFAAVACDVATGKSVVLQSGRVATAIQASTAIPMVVRPVEREGRVLVDGGVTNAVPAMVARSMGADLVIAVDITVPGYSAGPPRNLFDSLMNAFDITSEHLAATELDWADVVIRPEFKGLGQSLKNAAAFIQQGEEAAKQAVPLIRRKMAHLSERLA